MIMVFSVADFKGVEPAASRKTINYYFEDSVGILAVAFAVIIMAISLFALFINGFPGELTAHFSVWIAIILLLVPPATYIFSFWAYRQILFNEQLKVALNLYSSNKNNFRDKIYEKVKDKFDDKTTQAKASQIIRDQIDDEASRAVVGVYGVTVSAYFPVLIILELIVCLGFVIPIYELISYGSIGYLHLSIWPGTVSISSWVWEWAFFGAFVHSFFNMMDRVPRKDIRPNFYLNILIRFILSIAIASVFYLSLELFGVDLSANVTSISVLAATVFIIGMFPNIFLRSIEDRISKSGPFKQSLSTDMPLSNLPGISRMEASRLWEEGIHNIDQLADCTIESLHRKTHYDYCRLYTIIGSAALWKLVSGDLKIQLNNDKSTSRMCVLNSLGINNIQSLYYCVFNKSLEDTWKDSVIPSPDPKILTLLSTKLDLEPEFITNIAKTGISLKLQLTIPPTPVESFL
jgi:hypothetical protein